MGENIDKLLADFVDALARHHHLGEHPSYLRLQDARKTLAAALESHKKEVMPSEPEPSSGSAAPDSGVPVARGASTGPAQEKEETMGGGSATGPGCYESEKSENRSDNPEPASGVKSRLSPQSLPVAPAEEMMDAIWPGAKPWSPPVAPAVEPTKKCPRCDSPEPQLHPAMQYEGEVQPCTHPFHGAAVVEPKLGVEEMLTAFIDYSGSESTDHVRNEMREVCRLYRAERAEHEALKERVLEALNDFDGSALERIEAVRRVLETS